MTLKLDEIKTGNVGLIRVPFNILKTQTYISVPVRLVLDSPISHAVLFWRDKGELKVVEALPFVGVISTLYEIWVKQFEREIEIINWECSEENFVSEIGKEYDFAAPLWSHVCYRITHKWNGRTGKHAEKKIFCFELVLKAHNKPYSYMGHPRLITNN